MAPFNLGQKLEPTTQAVQTSLLVTSTLSAKLMTTTTFKSMPSNGETNDAMSRSQQCSWSKMMFQNDRHYGKTLVLQAIFDTRRSSLIFLLCNVYWKDNIGVNLHPLSQKLYLKQGTFLDDVKNNKIHLKFPPSNCLEKKTSKNLSFFTPFFNHPSLPCFPLSIVGGRH